MKKPLKIAIAVAIVVAVVVCVPFPRSLDCTQTGFPLDERAQAITITIDATYWRSLIGFKRIYGKMTINDSFTYDFPKGSGSINLIPGVFDIGVIRYTAQEVGMLYFFNDFSSYVCKTNGQFFAAPAETREEALAILDDLRERIWIE
ncbi:hypothetical protein FACS18949_15020 [Clostridia bacterium]|nr:hypothetical protein FACS189425_01030 [Clostridia bacterium]GHV36054.1 hypothetical protein FACS18949_15020 [Clostridia bacterium]